MMRSPSTRLALSAGEPSVTAATSMAGPSSSSPRPRLCPGADRSRKVYMISPETPGGRTSSASPSALGSREGVATGIGFESVVPAARGMTVANAWTNSSSCSSPSPFVSNFRISAFASSCVKGRLPSVGWVRIEQSSSAERVPVPSVSKTEKASRMFDSFLSSCLYLAKASTNSSREMRLSPSLSILSKSRAIWEARLEPPNSRSI
mmetsp:Transcript_6821/g.15300  ORF Transcript_6821/g.15300 Transcript_6821/m.15300 type:complete len:206 (+) Transcript_6821:203-820(+)